MAQIVTLTDASLELVSDPDAQFFLFMPVPADVSAFSSASSDGFTISPVPFGHSNNGSSFFISWNPQFGPSIGQNLNNDGTNVLATGDDNDLPFGDVSIYGADGSTPFSFNSVSLEPSVAGVTGATVIFEAIGANGKALPNQTVTLLSTPGLHSYSLTGFNDITSLEIVSSIGIRFDNFVLDTNLGPSAPPTPLWVCDSSGEIGTVDAGSGAVSLLGNAGVILTDIAFSPSGQLYGISFTSLYSINTKSGVATFIGNLGAGLGDMVGLEFDNSGTLYAVSAATTQLYRVNTTTGQATALTGNLPSGAAGDISFVGGVLYMADSLGDLDRLTVSGNSVTASVIGAIGFDSVDGLAAANGVLYGVSGTDLITINTTSGVGTLDLDYDNQGLGAGFGMAFNGSSPPPPAVLSGSVNLTTANEDAALPAGTTIASFTDSNTGDSATGFSATINWGDGTTPSQGTVGGSNASFTVSGGHTYAEDGSYPLSVAITRTADNTQLSLSGTVVVPENDVLTPHALIFTAAPGQSFSGTVATFSDSYTITTAGELKATIDWGDGTAETSGTVSGSSGSFTVSGTHTYATAGPRVVAVTLTDDTESATANSGANVSAVPGSGELLFQNDSGQPAIWTLNGASVTNSAVLGANPGPSWQVIGSGDFNGDGNADILFQNENGQPAIWLTSGTSVTASALIGSNPGPSWHVIAAADFNGDGDADILFQNSNGQPAIWLMNGTSVVSAAAVGPNPGPSWHVVGAGDFSGPGDDDILFQNANGQVAVWLINGTSVTNTAIVGPNPGPSWHVIGSGDFNGDGNADILFQNENGQPAIWLTSGTSVTASALIGSNPGPSWHVIAAADFNGDGNADILFQNDSGQVAIWLMNGTSVTSSALVGANPGPSWHAVGAADFNGDGKADILFRNDSGQAALWFMNGTSVTSTALAGPNPGPSWHLPSA